MKSSLALIAMAAAATATASVSDAVTGLREGYPQGH